MMVTVKQIQVIDPVAAAHIVGMRAKKVKLDREWPENPDSLPGWRGVVVSQLNNYASGTDNRHVFIEAVWGIEGGSCKQLTTSQCKATTDWLGDGNEAWVSLIVMAALKAAEQATLPGLTAEARADIIAGEVGVPDAEMAEINQQLTKGDTNMSKLQEKKEQEAKKVSEVEAPWTATPDTFFAWTADQGLTLEEILKALGDIEEIQSFTGTKADAKHAIQDYATAQITASNAAEALANLDLTPTDREHGESAVVAWVDGLFAPNGLEIHLTARQGAMADDVTATCLALSNSIDTLLKLGWNVHPQKVYVNSPAVKAQAEAPAAPPAPPSTSAPSAGPPPPSLPAGPPPAPSGPPPAPAAPSGNGGEYVRVPASHIVSQLTTNGTQVFRIKGGRMTKTGATCWPEVAETLAQYLGGWNPVTEMTTGQELEISGYGLVALCEPPATGKKWPGKVVEFVKA